MAQRTLDALGASIEAVKAKHGIVSPQVGGPASRPKPEMALAESSDVSGWMMFLIGFGVLTLLLMVFWKDTKAAAVKDALNNQTTCLRSGGEVIPSASPRYMLCRNTDGVLSRISPLTEERAMIAVRRLGAERMLAEARP